MTQPRVLIVIPARYASVRFPGKPLALLNGRPLIHWTWEAAMRLSDLAEIVVATDDPRIADAVAGFGGQVAMTSPAARNGTERCAEAVAGREVDLVVNLQGDSPLVRRGDVTALIDAWRDERGAEMVTPYVTCDDAMEAAILAEHRAGRVGGTTVVTDRAGRALYFSKLPIPFRSAYTPAALARYAAWQPGALELAEGLEQLRFLEHGGSIATVEVPHFASGFWEVNNPEDIGVVGPLLDHRP
jgi:3-deoxy-manno-octulosonate cytidylyltransferase (CMP-KDO synthetase)